MTSLELLLWILAGIVLQLGVFLTLTFVRYWRQYQRLSLLVTRQELSGELPEPEESPFPAAAEETQGWQGFRSFRVALVAIENADNSIRSFHLVPEDGQPLPPFLPGQFLTFRLDLPQGPLIRCYSLSDAPQPDHYRVTIKRVPSGLASNFFHDRVVEGSTLQVRAPSGYFHLDAGRSPVILIGGGIGITPVLSMLLWSLTHQPDREIWLFYGVRNCRDHIMKTQLETLKRQHDNFHLHVCYSQPLPGDVAGRDYQHHGHVDIALLRQLLPLKPYHFYICGSPAMMESLVPALDAWGVPDTRIHFEAFGPASIQRPAKVQEQASPAAETMPQNGLQVSFARSEKQVAWDGQASLLELAERNGISIVSGCRIGSCGSCQAVIRSGEVTYRQTPNFDPEPGACLLCICQPKTDLVLEA